MAERLTSGAVGQDAARRRKLRMDGKRGTEDNDARDGLGMKLSQENGERFMRG